MKQNQIEFLPNLKTENLENIFNVYQNKDSKYFYNLLQTVELPSNLPKGYYNTYTIRPQDTWPTISYEAYDTPNLWWVIAGANNIMNPIKLPPIGTVLKVYKPEVVAAILEQITSKDN